MSIPHRRAGSPADRVTPIPGRVAVPLGFAAQIVTGPLQEARTVTVALSAPFRRHGIADEVLAGQVETYAGWLRELRLNHRVVLPDAEPAGPLLPLGRELRLLAETLAQRERGLLRLFDLVKNSDQGVLLDDLLAEIFRLFKRIIPYNRVACAFLSDDGQQLTAYWAASDLPGVKIQPGYTGPMAGSSLLDVLATGQPRIINDLVAYLAAKPGSHATRRVVAEGGRSSMACPLFAEGSPLGFIFFTSGTTGSYHKWHQSIFRLIADQVSLAIHRSRTRTALAGQNSRLRRKTEELESASTHDRLTGLLNRDAIKAALQQSFTRHFAGGPVCGVIALKIDNFAALNDRLGYAGGDDVLKEFARRIGCMVRRSDPMGRPGGNELLIVTATGDAALAKIAERMRRVTGDIPFHINGTAIEVTASFGVAQPGEATDGMATTGADQLLLAARSALQVARAAGGNVVMCDRSCRPAWTGDAGGLPPAG